MTNVLVIVCIVMALVSLSVIVGACAEIKARDKAKRIQREPVGQSGDVYALQKGHCPACTSPALLSGPSGGMSMNVACNSCLMEYVAHASFGGALFRVDRSGPMTEERARTFGIDVAEYKAITRRGI